MYFAPERDFVYRGDGKGLSRNSMTDQGIP